MEIRPLWLYLKQFISRPKISFNFKTFLVYNFTWKYFFTKVQGNTEH